MYQKESYLPPGSAIRFRWEDSDGHNHGSFQQVLYAIMVECRDGNGTNLNNSEVWPQTCLPCKGIGFDVGHDPFLNEVETELSNRVPPQNEFL